MFKLIKQVVGGVGSGLVALLMKGIPMGQVLLCVGISQPPAGEAVFPWLVWLQMAEHQEYRNKKM